MPVRSAKAKRNASDTRERILQVAIAEFADKGLDGSRVDEIARAAGVNKYMLYHYFGNKRQPPRSSRCWSARTKTCASGRTTGG